ncbi:MAG: Uma2 family endonuclease [Planctomycetaceae bacterium]|nr:MAG: Uma2 family endonuclease [Planctomycetaceae bacterium]
MSAAIVFEDDLLEIPANVGTFDAFRRWVHSPRFPERGRIDFVANKIEIDMSPENLFHHGELNSEIHSVLYSLAKREQWGHVFVDRARISNPKARLSAEPDVTAVSFEAIETGRVHLLPAAKSSKKPGQFIEMEGSPDLVVEVVSEGSRKKDTLRLPSRYFRAGIREFWLADALQEELRFEIFRRGRSDWVRTKPDAEGFRRSEVFQAGFRLTGCPSRAGGWRYDLKMKELS